MPKGCNKKANPCFDCQFPVQLCLWMASRGEIPVPGWTAEPAALDVGKHFNATYHIIKCPLYVPPERRAEHRTERGADDDVCD